MTLIVSVRFVRKQATAAILGLKRHSENLQAAGQESCSTGTHTGSLLATLTTIVRSSIPHTFSDAHGWLSTEDLYVPSTIEK